MHGNSRVGGNRRIRILVLLATVVGLLIPAQAAQAACGDVWSQNLTAGSNFTAKGSNGDTYAVYGYWSGTHITPHSGTCNDINFRNDSRLPSYYPDGRGAYKSSSGTWYHGAAGWVDAPIGQHVVVISGLLNGRSYKVAGDQSMAVTVAA